MHGTRISIYWEERDRGAIASGSRQCARHCDTKVLHQLLQSPALASSMLEQLSMMWLIFLKLGGGGPELLHGVSAPKQEVTRLGSPTREVSTQPTLT